jgi:hypothetical protein
MKLLSIAIAFCTLAFGFIGCKDGPTKEEEDIMRLIYKLASEGKIVDVDDDTIRVSGGEIRSIVPGINTFAISVCDPFGWGGDYDDFCFLNGTKGRALARQKAGELPAATDIAELRESGSDVQPYDFPASSFMYFSKAPENYPNYADSSVSVISFRSSFGSLGPGWGNAHVDWCEVGNHPERCDQLIPFGEVGEDAGI